MALDIPHPAPDDRSSVPAGELFSLFDYLWPPEERSVTAPKPAVRERRAQERYRLDALTRLAGSRVHPGIHMVLVDLSATGALFETRNRFAPRMMIRVILETRGGGDIAVDGVVLRSYVHSISARQLVYRTAVRFFTPIPVSETL